MKPTRTIAIAVAIAVAAGAGVLAVRGLTADSAQAAAQCEPGRINTTMTVDTAQFGDPDGLAIVAANTANNPLPSLGATAQSLLVEFVQNSPATSKRPYLFSAVPGAPTIEYRWTKLSETGTESGTAARVAANLRNISEALATPPAADGLAMFEALTVAVEQLVSDGSQSPLVILVGSGLDDSGPLDMTMGLLNDDPASIAEQVAQAYAGVDLSGTTVVLQSLGYTHEPQELPSAAQRSLINEVWAAALSELGATVVTDPAPTLDCSITTDRTVQVTELPAPTIICAGQTMNYELPASLLFAGDSHALRDGVADLLAEPIQILQDNPDTTVELVGHTASSRAYTAKELIKLSTQRAKAVARVLREAGINAARITVRGVGDTEPKQEDLNPDGTQNKHAAAERRVDLSITGVTACPDATTQPTTK